MVGDFGNLQADQFGQANTMVLDRTSSLSSGSLVDILGRSLVVRQTCFQLVRACLCKPRLTVHFRPIQNEF